jgi:hypothetical protein
MALASVLPRLAFPLALLGCHPQGPPTEGLPEALVLRVDAVQVSPSRPGSGDAWDGREPEGFAGTGCRVIAAGVTMFEPTAGAVLSPLCGLASKPEGERDPSDPDLIVRVGAGATTSYSSFVVPDTRSQSLQYELVVPVAAIPADGLRVDVLDDDKGGAELIGGMRLSQSQLERAYRSPSKLLVLSGGGVQRLEVVVSGYTQPPVARVSRKASDQPFAPARPVKAGELVSIKATGTFTVGSWYDATLTPAGYPGNEARSYNLAPFRNQPHACAIALIGNRPTIEGIAIGSGNTFIAPHAGPLRLGLNDRDLSNNEGQVTYEVALRAPTAQEWLHSTPALMRSQITPIN